MTVNRPVSRSLAAMIAAAVLSAAMPAPASAQGLFDFLFGTRRSAPQPVPSYADPGDPQSADAGERADRSAGGPAVAFCVRTCDGHFFPIQRNSSASPVETCQSLCPAATTKIYNGSGIASAVSLDGKRYSDLPNAFAYRDKIVSNCTCNGKTAFGLANIDVKSDPTLKPGDIVATHEGLTQFRAGARRGAGEFTPISKAVLMADKKLSGLKVAPRGDEPVGVD